MNSENNLIMTALNFLMNKRTIIFPGSNHNIWSLNYRKHNFQNVACFCLFSSLIFEKSQTLEYQPKFDLESPCFAGAAHLVSEKSEYGIPYKSTAFWRKNMSEILFRILFLIHFSKFHFWRPYDT